MRRRSRRRLAVSNSPPSASGSLTLLCIAACFLPFCIITICLTRSIPSYGLLLVVVIVYAVVNNHPGLQICALSDTSKLSAAAVLSRVYKCIVAGMAFVLGTAFLIYGTRALVIFSGFQLVDKARLRNLLLLTITSTLGLLLQCVLLLLTSFSNVLRTLSETRAVIRLR